MAEKTAAESPKKQTPELEFWNGTQSPFMHPHQKGKTNIIVSYAKFWLEYGPRETQTSVQVGDFFFDSVNRFAGRCVKVKEKGDDTKIPVVRNLKTHKQRQMKAQYRMKLPKKTLRLQQKNKRLA